MSRFVIEGGHKLQGTIRASGNKNAALAVLPACLLSDQPITLHNIPDIQDVRTMLLIMQDLGAEVCQVGDGSWRIHARNLHKTELDPALAGRVLAGHFLKNLNLPVAGPPRQDVLHQFHAHFKDKGHQGTQRSDDDRPDEDDLLVPQLDFFTQAQRHAQP